MLNKRKVTVRYVGIMHFALSSILPIAIMAVTRLLFDFLPFNTATLIIHYLINMTAWWYGSKLAALYLNKILLIENKVVSSRLSASYLFLICSLYLYGYLTREKPVDILGVQSMFPVFLYTATLYFSAKVYLLEDNTLNRDLGKYADNKYVKGFIAWLRNILGI